MNLKVVFVAVVVLLSSGCSPAARAGSLPTEVIGIFPRDVAEFAVADLRQVRTLSWFPEFQKQVLPDQLRQFELFLASPGMGADSFVEQVAWGVVPSSSAPRPSQGAKGSQETIIVALGQFSPESTDAYFRARKRKVVNILNYSLYPLGGGSGDGGSFVCFMNSTVAVLGGREELERVIGIDENEEPSLLSNSDLAPLISQANPHSVIWGVLSASNALMEMQQLIPLIAKLPQSQQLLSTVHAFTLEIDADRGTQSSFEAVCASSDDAKTLAALLQAGLLYQSSHSGASIEEVSALLNQAKVGASGDRLDVTLQLADDQVVALLQHNSF